MRGRAAAIGSGFRVLAALLALLALLIALEAGRAAQARAQAKAPTAVPAGRITSAPPAAPDPHRSYVFYLHGRIVEQQGANAVSPEFGRYEYSAILAALAQPGHDVISELRPPTTAVAPYARTLVAQIRALLAARVPATSITVIGASKGGAIAMRVSQTLDTAGIGYVLLASCTPGSTPTKLHGDILSIYEHNDPVARSCQPWFTASPKLAAHQELELHTNQRHGFLYRPLPEWLTPALAWTNASTRK